MCEKSGLVGSLDTRREGGVSLIAGMCFMFVMAIEKEEEDEENSIEFR